MLKPVHEMTAEEVNHAVEHMECYYARCEAIGQGISCKDQVRYRSLVMAKCVHDMIANPGMGGDFPMEARA